MLSTESAELIRETLPAVGDAIGDISALFYDKMFAARPELLRDLFNRGNQANGSQQQALAGSIVAFARAAVDNPDTPPEKMLARVANKHASLGITPEQYRLVYEHLFAAIADVLGQAAQPDVVAAWSEVYWTMADTLITIENGLYAAAGASERDTYRSYRVVARYTDTDDVTTFQAVPVDGSPVPPGEPGQYVSVRVPLPDGAHQIRQYSLTHTRGDTVRFAVKRLADDPAGEVSNFLHDHVEQGDRLDISAPFGDVTLDDSERPVLLVSAGIGCTPMISMLDHLAATDSHREVVVVHADQSADTHPMRADLDQLVAKLPDAAAHVFYEHPQPGWPAERTGYVDLSTVEIGTNAVAYLCGPLPFLRSVRTQLLQAGVAAADIHYEVFGPDMWLN